MYLCISGSQKMSTPSALEQNLCCREESRHDYVSETSVPDPQLDVLLLRWQLKTDGRGTNRKLSQEQKRKTNNAPQQEREAKSIENSFGGRQRVIRLPLRFATLHKARISTMEAFNHE